MAWWKLHNGGVLEPDAVVAPDERLSWGKTIGLGARHVVAMFGATFVFPLLMGLNPQLAVMTSGVATLVFLAMTRNRVPSYLGSSASFVGVATANALGTIVVVALWHIARAIAPRHLADAAGGSLLVLDAPGMYLDEDVPADEPASRNPHA